MVSTHNPFPPTVVSFAYSAFLDAGECGRYHQPFVVAGVDFARFIRCAYPSSPPPAGVNPPVALRRACVERGIRVSYTDVLQAWQQAGAVLMVIAWEFLDPGAADLIKWRVFAPAAGLLVSPRLLPPVSPFVEREAPREAVVANPGEVTNWLEMDLMTVRAAQLYGGR